MMGYNNNIFSNYRGKNSAAPPVLMPGLIPAIPGVPMEEIEEMEQAGQMEQMRPMQTMIPYQQMVMPIYPVGCPFMGSLGNAGSLPGIGGSEGMWESGMSPISSDPPPILSNNRAITTINSFKQLTGYPNYGNPSGNADILYTGNSGIWTFDIPATVFSAGTQRPVLVIRAVLDDHDTPINNYSARITINGNVVHTGQIPLEHGRPAGGRFINWRDLSFNIRNYRRNTRVTIENTSTNARPDDWIGLDWMEIRITPR